MATTYTITAPNEGYTGETAGVAFARGVGEAVDPAPHVLHYFARHGYQVARKGGRKAPAKSDPKPKDGDQQPGDGPKE